MSLRRSLSQVKAVVLKRFSDFRHEIDLIRYIGTRFHCPLCDGHFRKLQTATGWYSIRGQWLDHATENATCPRCGSGIRHRFAFTFLQRVLPDVSPFLKVLHFAPEQGFFRLFRRPGIEYYPCDLNPPPDSSVRTVDITAISFPTDFLDLVVCIHVLEHVKEDMKAIREIGRCLKPGGRALVAVPIYGETTFDDDSLDFQQREEMYGIGDHMRLNGLDLKDKLQAAGFEVETLSIDDVPGTYVDRTVRSPHVDSDKYLFWCRKQE